jgi:hypothetical protein
MKMKKDRTSSLLNTLTVMALLVCIAARSQNLAVTSSGEVISGGPSAAAAREALQTRIDLKAAGKISIASFKPTETKLVKRGDNSTVCEFGFEAQLQFSEPSQWFLREKTATNSIARAFQKGEAYTAFGSVQFFLGTNGWTASDVTGTPRPTDEVLKDRCTYNLRFISAAFAQYVLEHDGHYPFNLGTNSGGTLELCRRRSTGFDENSAPHYRVMAEFLGKPGVLVCPADLSRQAATEFSGLTSTNVTYQLRSNLFGTDSNSPTNILTLCPIHHLCLDAGGDIQSEEKK